MNGKQVGFQCYSAYIPGKPQFMYSNRVVISPDFQGFGVGLKFINETAAYMDSIGFTVRATFSSIPLYKARLKDKKWKLKEIRKDLKVTPFGSSIGRAKNQSTIRSKVTVFAFEYIGNEK